MNEFEMYIDACAEATRMFKKTKLIHTVKRDSETGRYYVMPHKHWA